MEIFLFISIYLIVCNWFQLLRFLSVIVGPKYKTSSVDDKWIKNIVKQKTGLTLLDITIFHDKKLFGMMPGLPFWPKMVLSEGLYKSLNKDELEWVILHEAAHCLFWHVLQFFIVQMFFIFIGLYLIPLYNFSIPITIVFSILISLISIQIFRWGMEYAADQYAITRVDNPRGVITAQAKFRKANSRSIFNSEKNIFKFLLHWNIYSSQRIAMAKQRLNNI